VAEWLTAHPAHGDVRARARGDWRPKFLEALERTGMVSAAAAAAGIGRRTAYDHRKRDEAFAERWDDVVEDGVDARVQRSAAYVSAARSAAREVQRALQGCSMPSGLRNRPEVLDITDPDIRARSRDLLQRGRGGA
jgi:hypothetical protein